MTGLLALLLSAQSPQAIKPSQIDALAISRHALYDEIFSKHLPFYSFVIFPVGRSDEIYFLELGRGHDQLALFRREGKGSVTQIADLPLTFTKFPSNSDYEKASDVNTLSRLLSFYNAKPKASASKSARAVLDRRQDLVQYQHAGKVDSNVLPIRLWIGGRTTEELYELPVIWYGDVGRLDPTARAVATSRAEQAYLATQRKSS